MNTTNYQPEPLEVSRGLKVALMGFIVHAQRLVNELEREEYLLEHLENEEWAKSINMFDNDHRLDV